MQSFKYIIAFCFLLWGGLAQAQQELSLHFTDHLAQNSQTNAANFAPNKFTVTGLSFSGNAYHSAFSFNDFATWQGNTLQIRWADAINLMDDTDNEFAGNVNMEVLGLQFQIKDNLQISLFQNFNLDQRLAYSKSMAELFYYGNGQRLDQFQQIAPAYDFMAYNEYGVGVAYKANEKLNIGARIKYLAGMGAIYTERSLANLYTDSEYYQLTFNTDMLVHTAGFNLSDVDLDNISADSLNFDTGNTGGGNGIGIDLGVQFQLSEKLQLGASIRDLGSINWKENVSNFKSEGTYEFAGFNVNEFIDNDSNEPTTSQILDSLSTALGFKETNESFKSPLTTQFALTGKYQLPNRMSLGAIFYADMRNERLNPAFAVNWQKQVKNWLNFGVLAGVRQGGVANLGLNGTLNLGFFQLYAVTDNIIPVLNYKNAKHVNLRMGANLIFGRNKIQKEEEAVEEAEKNADESILFDRRQKG